MISSLRRKFIAIAMCSVIIVLGVIIGAVNITNYYNINQKADELLAILADNDGSFPLSEDKHRQKKELPPDLSPEAPFDTRYFTVELDEDGEVDLVDTSKIFAVSPEEAEEYASALYEKNKMSGFEGNYKYRQIECDDGVMYIFVDCSQSLSTFYSFLFASILASSLGLLFVFVLVLIFSKIAVRPVSESYEKQKRFITDASHEIKTPLTIIDANAEVLSIEGGDNEWLESIRNQIKRLSELTDKLVFLSRMDEENTSLQMTDFSISDAIYETAQPFKAIAQAHEKEFEIQIEKYISFHGDEAAIRQMVSLLVDNAMKYSNEKGKIELTFKTNGKLKELTIKNSVTAIEKGRHDALFERFYRKDSSRSSETGGQGIGLSVVKAIVTAHKGKISARSDDEKSIIFTVVLT